MALKAFTAILLLFSIFLLNSCGSSQPRVHAANPPAFTPPHVEQICPTGCIAMQGSPDFLELRFGPTVLDVQNGFSTSLPFAMHVSHLDAWIGTSSGAVFESDSRLQVILPDGTFIGEWKAQYDKHQDIVGDLQRNFTVNMDLPQGTTLIVYSTGAGVLTCPSGCGFDTTWSMEAF